MLKQIVWWLVILTLVAGVVGAWTNRFGDPEEFVNPADEYRYGSTGSDHPMAMAPIPYWIWKALPEVAPPSTIIPELGRGAWNGKDGFEAFGLVTQDMPRPLFEDDKHFERPIGFSRRNVFGVDFVGVNCAFCHLTTLRGTPEGETQTVLAGTGNAVYIEQYFLYMFDVIGNEELFTSGNVMPHARAAAKSAGEELNWLEQLIYRVAIWVIPSVLESRKEKYFGFITPGEQQLNTFGPGRVDTWAVYKRLYGDPPQTNKVDGIVDFPPFWNGKARTGMRMHWDGNISVPLERNIISALAVIGERLEYLDFSHVERIADFANDLMPPRYEDRVPPGFAGLRRELVEQGERVFESRCAVCHAPDGERVGMVERLEDIGTDDQRHIDFSNALANGINQLGTDEWQLRNFAPQAGYVNVLLDGIWLRAPYLHNGSVPTLRDLLSKPEDRPKIFCTGNNVYDWESVGFVSQARAGAKPCGVFFEYDTSVTGNSNAGHLHGTDLSEGDKDALVEFLKTL